MSNECWFSQVHWSDGTVETVADCMDCRQSAIQATRNWFSINEIEAEPFQVFQRFVKEDTTDRVSEDEFYKKH